MTILAKQPVIEWKTHKASAEGEDVMSMRRGYVCVSSVLIHRKANVSRREGDRGGK